MTSQENDAISEGNPNYRSNLARELPATMKNAQTSPDIDSGWAWIIALTAWISSAIASGLYYSFGLCFGPLLQEFQMSRGLTASVGSLNNGIYMLGGPIASYLIMKIGTRYTIMIGGTVAMLGYALSGLAHDLLTLFFTYGIVTAFGLCLNYTSWIIVMSDYFREKYQVVYSLTQSGVGIGVFVFGPSFSILLEHYSWRGAFIVTGGVAFHLVVCGALVFPPRKPPPLLVSAEEKQLIAPRQTDNCDAHLQSTGRGSLKDTEKPNEIKFPTNGLCSWSQHFSSFFWLFATSILYILMADYTRSIYLEEYYVYMLSAMGIGDLFGRLLTGPILKYWNLDAALLYFLAQLLCSLSILSFLFVANGIQMIAQGFVFSLCYGFQCVLLALVPRSIYGSQKDFQKVLGITLFFGGIGILIGSPLAAILVDHTSSYTLPLVFAGLVELLAAFSTLACLCCFKRRLSNRPENRYQQRLTGSD